MTSEVTSEPQIPLNDLSRGTKALREEIDAAVARVLDSGYFVLGPENKALERELSEYTGATDVILVGNGTDALQLALASLGVTAGDTVATVANAGGYTSTAIRLLGARPSFVDVEPTNHLMSLRTLETAFERMDELPRAIVVTHLFGAVVEMEPIVRFARERGVSVVEDCAQALGARATNGQMVGTFGDISTTSFYPTKNLGALGDAGAVFTSTPNLASRVRSLRQYGWETKYHATLSGGMNSRLDEMQAAILRVKLTHLDEWNGRRNQIHGIYQRNMGEGARLVSDTVDGFIGHLAVLEVDDRPRAIEIFNSFGIGTDVHYPIPDHLQAVAGGSPDPHLEITEEAAKRVLSIPLFPELRDAEIERVCVALASL